MATKSKPSITDIVIEALEDIKAKDIRLINVTNLTSVSDHVAIASADSNRQTRALANNVVDKVRAAGFTIYGTEGEDSGEWVLVDCGDVVVHIMQPAVREYYKLEELWLDGTLEFPKPKKELKAKAEAAKPLTKATKQPAAGGTKKAGAKVVKKPIAKTTKKPAATQAKVATVKVATAKVAKKLTTKAAPATQKTAAKVAKKPAAKVVAVAKKVATKPAAAPKLPAVTKKPVAKNPKAAATTAAKVVAKKAVSKKKIVKL